MKTNRRINSKYAGLALEVFGKRIRLERKLKKMTAAELAERAGVSRGLVQRIEQGNPSCEIGVAFELASILGVSLFDLDHADLGGKLDSLKDKIALVPKPISRVETISNDF